MAVGVGRVRKGKSVASFQVGCCFAEIVDLMNLLHLAAFDLLAYIVCIARSPAAIPGASSLCCTDLKTGRGWPDMQGKRAYDSRFSGPHLIVKDDTKGIVPTDLPEPGCIANRVGLACRQPQALRPPAVNTLRGANRVSVR
jgi:hypothetical protein